MAISCGHGTKTGAQRPDRSTRPRTYEPNPDFSRSGPVRRHVEVDQLAPKATRFPGPEGEAERHPECAHDSRGLAEVQPKNQADRKSGQGGHRVAERPLASLDEVVHERGEVHPHEGDEGTEIE